MSLKHTASKQLNLIPPHSESLNRRSLELALHEINQPETQALIDRMFAIGNGEQGNPERPTLVGIAAPQIGINKRIILVGIDALGNGEPPQLQAFINPVIISEARERIAGREGCFSTSRVCGIVDRAQSVRVQAYDRTGNPVDFTVDGFPARIFQHEIDHLDGVRFPDRITDPARLHWVPAEQFGEYRETWETWQELCPPERWQAIKVGGPAKLKSYSA